MTLQEHQELIDVAWRARKAQIEKVLAQRTLTIQEQYNKDLTAEQWQRVYREEEFVASMSDFLNDCEGYVNIARNSQLEAQGLTQIAVDGSKADWGIIVDLWQENARLHELLFEVTKDKAHEERMNYLLRVYERHKEQASGAKV